MAETLRCVFKAKAGTNQAVKINDEWFEIREAALVSAVSALPKPYPEVEVTWEKQGYKKVITSLSIVGQAAPRQKPAATTVTTGSVSKPETTYTQAKNTEGTDWAKKDRNIRRGNALNAASYVLQAAASEGTDLDVIKEKVLYLAQNFYEWLETNSD